LRGSVVFKIVKLIPERYFQFLNDKLDWKNNPTAFLAVGLFDFN
jgi:hypothetical protein